MKVKEIELEKGSFEIYIVTLEPNWLEKLFGVKEKVVKYKETGYHYRFGGGGDVYADQNGEKLPNGNYIAEAIDQWRRCF